MSSLIKKFLIFLSFLSLFVLVVLYVEPPRSWEMASVLQIVAFFLPLLVGITALVDILMHYLPHSFFISLGIILFLAFYAVNQLSILTGSLVVLVTAFSVRVFPKMRMPRFRLTAGSKIPKLHMQKQEAPKLRRLRRLH